MDLWQRPTLSGPLQKQDLSGEVPSRVKTSILNPWSERFKFGLTKPQLVLDFVEMQIVEMV